MGWGRGYISAVALINWFALGVGAVAGGVLSDRIGLRLISTLSAFLVGGGLILASQAGEIWHLALSFGVMVGFGVGAAYTSLMASSMNWFSRNRALAAGIISTGIGMGIIVMAPLARALIGAWDWRVGMLVIGDLVWLVAIPASFVFDMHKASPSNKGSSASSSLVIKPVTIDGPRANSASSPFRSWQFAIVTVTHFACCAAHSGPVFHMVTNVIDRGLSGMLATSVFSVFGLASLGGRLTAGIVADRFG